MKSEQLAWLIRRHAVEMTHLSGGGHIGSILSVADIIAVLYSDILNYDPKAPRWDGRDRMILSKGHAGASIYAALAENGFFATEELKTHYADGSRLSGHVSHHVPGVDFSTGSLGHGLSAAAGMALAAKKDGKTHRVFVVLGDGECDEGSVWEAGLFACHFQLNNLTAVVDHNHMQSLDFCENTLKLKSLSDKWRAFGWEVEEIDGHDHGELKRALRGEILREQTGNGEDNERSQEETKKESKEGGEKKPRMVIANTIKGYPISFMENDILWHYRFPHDGWEYDGAVAELYRRKPDGVEDPYTPGGIPDPVLPRTGDDIGNDHTLSATYHPDWQIGEKNRKQRVER